MKKAALCLLSGIILLCISFCLPEILQNYQLHQEQKDLISGYLQNPEEEEPQETEPADDVGNDEKTENTLMSRIYDFDGLKRVNPDIVGWIYVPGTQIDYPICRGSDDSYYLTHSFRKSSNALGAIFVPAETSEELTDAHTILYGHNMRSGKMFGELSNYAQKSFRDQYPYVYIYTPEKTLSCTVYSAYRTRYDSVVYTIGYQFDTEDYRQWIDTSITSALYDCGIAPTGKEQIFTLSTCVDSGSANDRFVIHCVVTDQMLLTEENSNEE